MASFSERLITVRQSKNILQTEVASSAGISVRAYQYYEKGQKEPTLSVLIAIADFFDVSLDYLCGRSDDPTRH